MVCGPTISSVSLNAANSELTVTFSENVYNTNGGSGDLEVADFALSISGGAAGVNATPGSITKTAQNIWVLGVTITGTANGGETLTVVPARVLRYMMRQVTRHQLLNQIIRQV